MVTQTKIFEDLETAEAALTRAVAKLNHAKSGRMPNKTLWIGQIGEMKKAVSLLLKTRALKDKLKYHDV